MNQNIGLETRISKEEVRSNEELRSILSMVSGEIPPILVRIFFQDQTSHKGKTIRTTVDHMINAQINHSKRTIAIHLQMDFSVTRMESGEI